MAYSSNAHAENVVLDWAALLAPEVVLDWAVLLAPEVVLDWAALVAPLVGLISPQKLGVLS
jgi:hypothetical protein